MSMCVSGKPATVAGLGWDCGNQGTAGSSFPFPKLAPSPRQLDQLHEAMAGRAIELIDVVRIAARHAARVERDRPPIRAEDVGDLKRVDAGVPLGHGFSGNLSLAFLKNSSPASGMSEVSGKSCSSF